MNRWVVFSLVFTFHSLFAVDKLQCEKLSGSFEITHYGQSFVASYLKYRLKLTFDNARDVHLSTNWHANIDESFDGSELTNTWIYTLPPHSWEGVHTIVAAAEPQRFLSSLNNTVQMLTVAERNLSDHQDGIAVKKVATACAKQRLNAIAAEVRRKYLMTRAVDLNQEP